jgi:hypothetical protein
MQFVDGFSEGPRIQDVGVRINAQSEQDPSEVITLGDR